jgi:Holliday junction DNA helicase RuvA
MIAFLEGEVAEKGVNRAVLNVGGVGYELLIPASLLSSLPAVGSRAKVHVRTVVREDAITLYGFASADERYLFDLLTAVGGVGPKLAISFLSALEPDAIRRAVLNGDSDALTIVPGVGKKLAQRAVLDLRDKLGGEAEGDLVTTGPLADVREALMSLGLSPSEASKATVDLEADGKATDELLREALRRVGR